MRSASRSRAGGSLHSVRATIRAFSPADGGHVVFFSVSLLARQCIVAFRGRSSRYVPTGTGLELFRCSGRWPFSFLVLLVCAHRSMASAGHATPRRGGRGCVGCNPKPAQKMCKQSEPNYAADLRSLGPATIHALQCRSPRDCAPSSWLSNRFEKRPSSHRSFGLVVRAWRKREKGNRA